MTQMEIDKMTTVTTTALAPYLTSQIKNAVLLPDELHRQYELNEEIEAATAANLPTIAAAARRESWILSTQAWHRTNPDAFVWTPSFEIDVWNAWLKTSFNIYGDSFNRRLPMQVLKNLPEWNKVFDRIELRENYKNERMLVGSFDGRSTILHRWAPEDVELLTVDQVKVILDFRNYNNKREKNGLASTYDMGVLGAVGGIVLAIAVLVIAHFFGFEVPSWMVVPARLVVVGGCAVVGNILARRFARRTQRAIWDDFDKKNPGLRKYI